MALFSLKKIAQYAGSRQVYLRGVSCYGAGRVTHVTCTAQPPFAALWKAAVFSDDRTHTLSVQAGFDQNGELCHTSCSCTSGTGGGAVCRHVVALLVHKYYTDMLGAPVQSETVLPAQTDDVAATLLQRYDSDDPQADPLAVQVQIKRTPAPVLQLLVGNAHPFTVREWTLFCSRVQNGETAAYGNGEPFSHHPENFRPQDRALLQGLSALAKRRIDAAVAADRPLTDMEWELLTDWLSPCGFLLRSGSSRTPICIQNRDPVIPLTVQQVSGGILLQVEPYHILPRLCGVSLLYDQTLYRCSYDFAQQMLPFLQTMADNGLRQFWADRDLAAFCDTVWLQIAPSVSLQGDTAALLNHLPPTGTAEIYLEMPSRGCITAHASMRYGEFRVDLPSDRQDVRRNIRQEQQLLSQLRALFPLCRDGVFAAEGDDAALDTFLSDVFPTLQQLASVFVAGEDAALPAIRTQPSLQVGVQLNGGLLDLSVHADQWDTDELLAVWNSFRKKRTFHRLKNGQLVDLRDGQLVRSLQALEQAGVDERCITQPTRRLPSCRALLLQDKLDAGGTGWTADKAVAQLLQTVRSAAQDPAELPEALQPILREYQKQGVAFLQTLTRCGFGGILADDMGLGKTLQVLSLLQAQKGPSSTAAALVICPASLVLAWEHEAHKFTPDLRVRAVYGSIAQRRAILESDEPIDLLITSYDLLKRDLDWYRARPLRAVILDEAQYIKNHATRNARAVKALQAPCRLALTGTPLENRLSELWSIFDFLMPGFLFSYPTFRQRYEVPIVRHNDADALQRLQQHIAPFVLRRTKEQVLQELPPKTQTVRYAVAQDAQQKLYRAQLLAARGKLEQGAGKIEVLTALTRLRQICCDPSLCYGDYTGGSAKLDTCMQLLDEAIGGGHKVLLFSQFTSMLRLIAQRLQAAGHRFYLLQGSTGKQQRSQMVQAFNADDTPVMLVSLKAGGTGLNLTGADVVIHYDPWWNAAATDQATDRAHRIGQTKPVQVYTLLLKDTVEEKILLLQQIKRRLAGQVIPVGGGLLESISREQLLALLQD